MPVETLSGPDGPFPYFLIAYDKHGQERTDDPDGLMTDRVLDKLRTEPITDVFIMSHGWQGDLLAARDQYERWTLAMLQCTADRERIRQHQPAFRPLLIGFHWPSLPWGEEDLSTGPASFDPTAPSPLQGLIDAYAQRLDDTPAVREALTTIFMAALDDPTPSTLPEDVQDAYRSLNEALALKAEGPAGAPGDDREPFDPEQAYQNARATEGPGAVAFGGGFGLGLLLSPLRQLSFWTMKARARTVGERGGHDLLRALQQTDTPAGPVRIHLMGHSFGCIVVSSMLGGPGGTAPLPRPVDSVFLVQGALSLWAYCTDIPVALGTPGYFQRVIADGKVGGPIVTTQSERDTAVRRLYPLAAGVRGQVSFDPLKPPKYGAIGRFGIRGPGTNAEHGTMHNDFSPYHFEEGKIYNLDSTNVIREGGGPAGAHNDIDRPEVAHAFWAAAFPEG